MTETTERGWAVVKLHEMLYGFEVIEDTFCDSAEEAEMKLRELYPYTTRRLAVYPCLRRWVPTLTLLPGCDPARLEESND